MKQIISLPGSGVLVVILGGVLVVSLVGVAKGHKGKENLEEKTGRSMFNISSHPSSRDSCEVIM